MSAPETSAHAEHRSRPASSTTAAIHQPHFLPWVGYVNKIARSDVFIVLDTVQFSKNNFQNRTRILGPKHEPMWLTLPVHASLGTRLDAVTIADARWSDKVRKTLEQAYRRAPHFDECWPPLRDALAIESTNMAEVIVHTLRPLLAMLGLDGTRVVRASELPVDSTDPTERLIRLCQAVGADTYLAGSHGRDYMDLDHFARERVGVLWQGFNPAQFPYSQGAEPFVPGLSIVDALFHAGPAEAGALARRVWAPTPA